METKIVRTQLLPAEEEAEAIALKALTFLVRDGSRLNALQEATGIDLATLRTHMTERAVQVAVLDHLLSDESLLLIFAQDEGLDPNLPRLARIRLSGEDI